MIEAAGADPRAQFRTVFSAYAQMIDGPDFRGCPLNNVAIELAAPDHPGHAAVRDGKIILHNMLSVIANDLGVAAPERLADALILVIEGAMVSRQIFGETGPATAMTATCEALVDVHLQASAAASPPPITSPTKDRPCVLSNSIIPGVLKTSSSWSIPTRRRNAAR